MIRIAFDIGENIAYVRGASVGPLLFDTMKLKPQTRLGAWLRQADDVWRGLLTGDVGEVGYEMPFMGRDIYAARKLFGMASMIHYWADWLLPGVPVQPVMVQTGKYTLAGDRFAKAPAMIAAALVDGHEMNEHEAHAYGIWKAMTFGPRDPPPARRTRSSPGRSIAHG